MKKNYQKICPVFLFCLIFLCCKTIPPTLDFPSANNSQMVFTTPCKYKNSSIPVFSIDTTSFLNSEGFCAPTSVKFSICAKNLSKKQILDLEISLNTSSKKFNLDPKKVLYTEPAGKNILVRFESSFTPEQMEALLSEEIKSITIKTASKNSEFGFSEKSPADEKDTVFAKFNGKKINKKLLILKKYL